MSHATSTSKLMIQLFFLFISFFSFAQKEIDVVLKWETTKEYQVCRYCNEKAHKTYLNRMYFEDDRYTIPYKAALQKFYNAGLLKVALDYDKMSRECDISRTGKHGIDVSKEDFINTEVVKLSQLEAYVEEQKKQDELDNIKNAEKERVQSLNKSMLTCLDSINFYYQNVGKTGSKNSLNQMGVNLIKLLDLQNVRDNTDGYEISKTYKIEIAGNSQGFGSVYKEYNWLELVRMLQYATLFSGDFNELNNIINDWSQSLNSFELKVWVMFAQGDIDKSVQSFLKYFTEEGFYSFQRCQSILEVICDIQSNTKSYYYMRFHENPIFSTRNLVKLQIELMSIQTPSNISGGGTKSCTYNYKEFTGNLTTFEVAEMLNISESKVKGLLRKNVLKPSPTIATNIDASSVLFYSYYLKTGKMHDSLYYN